MSNLYAESNAENAEQLFDKRLTYYADARDGEYPNLEYFSGEKIMYGRVNRRFVPIAVPPRSIQLVPFKQSVDPQKNIRAFNFVVDAFNDLAQQFRKCALEKKIDTTDPYLTNLKVYKAYESSHQQYAAHFNKLSQAIKIVGDQQQIKIENFDVLVKLVLDTTVRSGLRQPFTFPAYVKSRHCSPNASGLVVEIADLDASNDDEKMNKFVKSKNWKFFLNACRTYGFMVDENVPWRLVADIGSSPMIAYATKYGANTTNLVLRNYYESGWANYCYSLPSRLLALYNRIRPKRILYTEECNGRIVQERRDTRTYASVDELSAHYHDTYFLELYCKIRFNEEESQFTDNEKGLIIDDVMEIARFKGSYDGLKKFEIILNKPFDYEGSLSYNQRKIKARDARTLARASDSTTTSGY